MEEVEWEGEVGTGLQLIGGIEGRKESRESESMQDKETDSVLQHMAFHRGLFRSPWT